MFRSTAIVISSVMAMGTLAWSSMSMGMFMDMAMSMCGAGQYRPSILSSLSKYIHALCHSAHYISGLLRGARSEEVPVADGDICLLGRRDCDIG